MLWIFVACIGGDPMAPVKDCRFAGMVPEAQCRAALRFASQSMPVVCFSPDGEQFNSKVFTASK